MRIFSQKAIIIAVVFFSIGALLSARSGIFSSWIQKVFAEVRGIGTIGHAVVFDQSDTVGDSSIQEDIVGHIGINTPSDPVAGLKVNSRSSIFTNGDVVKTEIFSGTESGVGRIGRIGTLTDHPFYLMANGIDQMSIDNTTGNVTVRNGRLTVGGSDLVLGTKDGRDQRARSGNRALVHNDSGLLNKDALFINYGGDFEGGVRVNGPQMIVDGDLGIGTGAIDLPQKLNVVGTGRFSQGATEIDIQPVAGRTATGFIGTHSNHPLSFTTNNTTQMTIGTDGVVSIPGNVGIGTESPESKLDVEGSIQTGNYLFIKSWPGYGTGSAGIWYDGVGGQGSFPGYLSINADTEKNNQLVIENGGNVGIGISNPSFKLHVGGNIMADNNVSAKGDVCADVDGAKKCLSSVGGGILPPVIKRICLSVQYQDENDETRSWSRVDCGGPGDRIDTGPSRKDQFIDHIIIDVY